MKKLVLGFVLLFLGGLSSLTVQAQTTGSMSGTVTDPNGALVGGATVTARNNATGVERTTTTGAQGTFSFEALQPGVYTVEVENSGFKKSVAPNINVSVAVNAGVNITLEVGLEGETVTVTAAQETINTVSPTLTNVINTRQVVDLPLPTRNPLDLAALQAGIAVVGADTRGSSVGGLRQTATNVTQDGINAMDNFVKTSSFFAISAPSLNSTAEFSITTNTVGSESGRGVAQVNMVTRGGSNRFSGGLFYLHRNDAFNANSFFNNQSGTIRPRQRQHFYGFDIGGPVYFLGFGEGSKPFWNGRDKAFFFFSYEGFRENFQATRNRTVLTPEARQGIFRYTGTNGQLQTVNLLQVGNVGVLNPITAALIAQTPAPNNTLVGDGFNTAGFRYNVSGTDQNDKYVARYDHQLVKDTAAGSHKFEFVFNRSKFLLSPDTFNGLEATFPGGVNAFQESKRYLLTGALVSNMGNWTNVFRYGRQWAPVGFLMDQNPTQPFIFFSGITQLYAGGGFLSQGRNTMVDQYKNDVSWSKGNHLIRFGADYQKIFAYTFNDAGINQSITLGTNTSNPSGILLGELPFGTNANLTAATAVYVNVVGLLGSSAQTLNVSSPTSGFVPGATRERVFRQQDLALYVQDQWRMRPNLSVNLGVRWEFEGVPTIPNGLAIQPNGRDIFGVSGFGNLFTPNAAVGAPPPVATLNFVSGDTGIPLYNDDWNNFAPFIGVAWSPNFDSGFGRAIFGSPGKSAIRTGFSISYLRDGFTVISNAMGVGTTNPGLIQTANIDAATGSPLLTGVLTGAGVTLQIPTFTMPVTDRANNLLNVNNGLWGIDPDLKVPYAQQWSFGFEREIFPNTAFEIRYVGNRAVKVWRANDFNEINIFENGFLQEFRNAQINRNARGGASATSFAPGCAGCVPLPIFDRLFAGIAAASGYGNTGFLSNLGANNIGTMANTLAFSTAYRANRENPANGFPANFWVANPNALFARLLTNDSASNYHALQAELRRRLSNGLQFQLDYTFSKALTDAADAQGNNQSDLVSFRTLRDKRLDWRRANFDQTHRFVSNVIYDLPFGRGRQFLSNANGLVDRLVGGWTVSAITTWSTRPPISFVSNRTTFNQFNPGLNPAQLLISFEEFRRNVGVYRRPEGIYYFNPDLLDITVNPTTGRYVSSTLKPGILGAPEPGTFGNFPLNAINGPQYFNLDMALVKRIPVTERVRLELKSTFINILNHTNFAAGSQVFDSTSFGLITAQGGGNRIIHFTGSVRF
ncbi:MAG TPA: TonB-dependent receptor [Pyrinomonadaceae bacterium]|nr:TonB-dependent receptor [Pyrinomonadaceae bacterium]